MGDFSVGKTSLINRYSKNTFNGNYLPTIGADFTSVSLKLDIQKDVMDIQKDVMEYLLNQSKMSMEDFLKINSEIQDINQIYIWDLAGEPIHNGIRSIYMGQTYISVIVIDLYRSSTFKIDSWINDVKRFCPDSKILLVGNKSDLIDLDNPDFKNNIKTLEQRYNLPIIITSAKDGKGVKELFTLIKLNIMNHYITKLSETS